MSEQRKRDIEAKRAKLEALRARRRRRKEKGDPGARSRSPVSQGKELLRDAENFVKMMSKPQVSPVVSPTPTTGASTSPQPAMGGMTYGPAAVLELVPTVNKSDVFPVQKSTYTKTCQVDTTDLGTELGLIKEDASNAFIKEVSAAFGSAKIKAWPPADVDTKALAEAEKKNKPKKQERKDDEYEPEPEQEDEPDLPPIMDARKANEILRTEEFKQFFTRASLVLERASALNAEIDIYANYNAADEMENADVEVRELVTFKKRYRHPETTMGRPVTSIAFSKLAKPLFLSSYAEPLQRSADVPDGTVHVWNKLLKDKPETMFQCQSQVTMADFHPTNGKLVVGATVSGSVVIWDMRVKKKTPQTRTPFHTSHHRAVYAMSLVPAAQKVINIFSVCNEGKLMVWRDDILEKPSVAYKLHPEGDVAAAREDILTTCFSSHSKNTDSVVYGSSDGYIYKGKIFMMQNDKKETNPVKMIQAHYGPITNVQFHPSQQNRTLSKGLANTFLTSSFDWTVKLWDNRQEKSIWTFEHMQDYIHDVRWSPVNPGVFACGDGLGKVNIFDLSKNWEVPVVEHEIAVDYEEKVNRNFACCRLQWSLDGKQLIAGDSNGDLMLYDVNQQLYDPSDEVINTFDQEVQRKQREKREQH